jgi:hypothetical protein
MSFYDVKLEKVNNNAYGFIEEFDDNPNFLDNYVIRVAFRTLGSRKHEHYLNTYAAKLTRHRGEKFPAGAMTHTELIVTLRPGVYLKASVIKKSYNGKDENGNILWKKGCVHLKKTDPREWQNQYVFLTLNADRRDIKRMTEFLVQQNGQDFNHAAYYANLLLPGGLSVKYFTPDLMNKAQFYRPVTSRFATERSCAPGEYARRTWGCSDGTARRSPSQLEGARKMARRPQPRP